MELDPENEQAKQLYEECKSEWDEDHTVSEDNPEKQRFTRLESWLRDGGSKFDKLKIRFYTPIYRGVHAAKRIRVGFILDILELLSGFLYLIKLSNF